MSRLRSTSDSGTSETALRRFEDKSSEADVGVLYYSGHGIEVNGQNYVLPIDAKLASDGDIEDEAVPLDRVMKSVEGVKRLKLVILDASRDNPFIASMRRSSGTDRLAWDWRRWSHRRQAR